MRCTWAALSLLILSAWPTSGETLDEPAWQRIERSGAVTPYRSRLDAAARAADEAAALATLRDALGDAKLSVAQREAVLHLGAVRLASLPGDPDEPLLRALATRPVTVWVLRDHDGHRVRLPAFDVAAAARVAQRERRVERDAARWAQILGKSSPLAAGAPAMATLDATALTRAVERADPKRLAERAAWLAAAARQDPALAPAALAAARRLDDTHWLAALAAQAPAPVALGAVTSLAAGIDPAARAAGVSAALARPPIASAAVLALAAPAREDAALLGFLIDLLDDPRHGASAAAALARTGDAAALARVAAELAIEADPQRAARLALALSLSHDPAAHDALRDYAASPGEPRALKEKLRRARPGEAR